MSAILSADDLNDFISPGVACIKPLQDLPQPTDQSNNENGEVEIQIDSKGNPLEISKIDGKQNNLSPAQISLADCLACSGCITSAEEVLVAQHSHQELIKALKSDKNKVFVASISQQSRASLATAYSLSVEEIDKLLINLFVNQMGFKYVVGTSLGRKLSLINESKNIIQKKEQGLKNPILSSICPGWVLYAEKTHPYVLPMISTVKSSQQITGCLLKALAAYDCGVSKSEIYHLSIMPCFDKKLESARPEIFGDTAPDVDCVLTAKELITLLDEEPNYKLIPKITPPIMNQNIDDVYKSVAPQSWPFVSYSWSNDPGSSSGGYAFNYLRIFQDDLMMKGYDESNFTMKIVQGKNSDIYEMRLMYKNEKLASAAIVNGFRNIQNLVRKLKPNNKTTTTKVNPLVARRRARMTTSTTTSTQKPEELADASKVDYVEIMACPSGCINGGGQIAPPKGESEKDWINESLIKYNSVPMFDLSLHPQDIEKFIEWSNEFEKEFHISDDRLFKTYFNEVEKPTDPTAIMVGSKW
ncbi:NAR1 [Candida pseudojiufengensis]|uniref:NAR1 n=1 Tax=Candida pseudojiufengensis TaxID=497109 RepID=UPI0022257886|nr:NAR1 [Candida pseudojiufengensis]KAI5966760.1 NAR1 [Candida pseudojiufengensis]